jgi:hypothetical protein
MPIATETRLKGTHQFTDVITDIIRNYAVTAIKLNPDVAGNGIILDENNKISFTGYTIVKNEAELAFQLASGTTTNILFKEGVYNIGDSLVLRKPYSFIGENKKNTLISLSPSGQIYFYPQSGQIVNGTATLQTESTVILSNPDVSGTMTFGSYAGASLILDDIPYKVVSVISGEVTGTAVVQLSEPYTSPSFVGKSFKMQYLLDFVVLKNIGFSSAYNDGIIKIDSVRNLLIDDVEIRGSDVTNSPSQGLNINNTFFSRINNLDVTLTKVTLPLSENKEYGVYISNSRYISLSNVNIYNTNSNGIYLLSDKFIELDGLKVFGIDGNPLRISASENITVNSSSFKTFGLKSTILNSDQILINGSSFTSVSDQQAIEITESHVGLLNNNFYNTYVRVLNTTQETIISSNEFENIVSTTNSLYIYGKERSVIDGNIFNTLATNSILVNSGNAIVSNNYFSNATNAVTAQTYSSLILSNNVVEQNTNGFVFDSTVTNSSVNNNSFSVSNYAINIAATGNYVTSNTLISGTVNLAFGNVFPFLTTFEPYYSGLVDIGSNLKPVKDIYVNNAVRSKNLILNNGAIFGANEINLSGHVVTVDASHLYIDGEDLAGLSLTDIQYVHNQVVVSSSWTIKHNLGTKNVAVTIFDEFDQMIEPATVSNIDVNKILVTFGSLIKGRAIVHSAGTKSNNTGYAGYSYTHQQTSLAPIWTISHNLQSTNLIVQTYDENDEMYLPSTVKFIDDNTVKVYNAYAKKGKAVLFSENAFNIGTSQYVFRQNVASANWTIPHNRSSKDFVISVYDDPDAGTIIPNASIVINDENTVYVNLTSGTVGRAILVFASANPVRFTDVKYVHTQSSLSTVWDILHNLNTEDVSVVMYDNTGSQILTGVNYTKIIDPDYVQVQFSSAKAGKAIVLAPISSNRITTIEDNVGTLTNLLTDDQTSIVNSVNEIYTLITDNDINKNRIVNGDFMFSYEYGDYNSGVVTSGVPAGIVTSGTYVGDIFKYNFSGAAQVAWTRTTDVPNTNDRSSHSIRFDVISGEAIGLNDFYAFQIPIEGYKIADTYNSTTSFSFYAKTNKPGTYSIALRGSHATSPKTTYITPFTVGAINTWEKISVVIPSDANWPYYYNDTGLGLEANIVLAAGSGYMSVGDNAWYADLTNDFRSPSQDTNLTEYTSGHMYITRLKYEKGNAATNFIPGDIADERRKMDRYYQVLSGKQQVTTYVGVNNDAMIMINHREEMRTTPTADIKNVMVSNNNTTWVSGTIVAIESANKYSTTLYTSYSGAYKFVGGDGSYDGMSGFIIHNKARL